MYTLEQVRAAALRRHSPEEYAEQLREKYIEGVNEESPAVGSLNALISSMAAVEFLARIHVFRDEPNGEFAAHRFGVTQGLLFRETDGSRCPVITRNAGRGDLSPLLGMPELSEGKGNDAGLVVKEAQRMAASTAIQSPRR